MHNSLLCLGTGLGIVSSSTLALCLLCCCDVWPLKFCYPCGFYFSFATTSLLLEMLVISQKYICSKQNCLKPRAPCYGPMTVKADGCNADMQQGSLRPKYILWPIKNDVHYLKPKNECKNSKIDDGYSPARYTAVANCRGTRWLFGPAQTATKGLAP